MFFPVTLTSKKWNQLVNTRKQMMEKTMSNLQSQQLQNHLFLFLITLLQQL